MTGRDTQTQTAKHAAPPADALMAHFAAAGFARTEPAVLQPAGVFLELSGEDIRSRMYLTTDAAGAEMCLRPEYTIPVCREYLASPLAGHAADLSYCGPVFRLRAGQPGEFIQAGLESFGRADRAAADAEILALSLEAATADTGKTLSVRTGDVGLFGALLDYLILPPVWQRRLRLGFGQGRKISALFEMPRNSVPSDHSGVLAALAGADRQGARALVSDLLSIAGISAVGGRSTGEIAERFLEQAALRADTGLSAEQKAVITGYLAVEGDPDTAARKIRALAADAHLALGPWIDALEERTGFMAARGLDVSAMRFSAAFGRPLDYYTGFVFEARDPAGADARPVIGGGRYDSLMKKLGAASEIAAVGAAVWIERLPARDRTS